MDRGAWRVTVHGAAKSQTRLKQLSMHARPLALELAKETEMVSETVGFQARGAGGWGA